MSRSQGIKDLCNDFVHKIIGDFFIFLQKEKKYSINTISSYQDDINHFINFIYKSTKNIVDKNILEGLIVNDFRGWLSERLGDHGNNSNARAISTLRSFFRFLNENNLIDNRQIFRIKTPKKIISIVVKIIAIGFVKCFCNYIAICIPALVNCISFN